MKRAAGLIYFYFFNAIQAALYLAFYPAFVFLLGNLKYQHTGHSVRRFGCRLILFLAGARCKTITEEKIDANKTYIICCNHASETDIILALAGTPLYFGFLGKVELTKNNLLAIFFKHIDIEVDRGNNMQSVQVYKKSVQALESGKSLFIFPEGGIFENAPTLNPFKDGAFSLAIRHKVPIIPACMPDNWKNFPDGKKFAKPGKIRLILHKPIETALLQKEDIPALQQQVFDLIEKDLKNG